MLPSLGGMVSMATGASTSRLASMRGAGSNALTKAGRPMQMTVPTVTALEASTGRPSRSNPGAAASATFTAVPGSVTKAMSMPHVTDTAPTSLEMSVSIAALPPPVAAVIGVTPYNNPGGRVVSPAVLENNGAANAAERHTALTRRTNCSAFELETISNVSTKIVASLRGSSVTPAPVVNCRTGIGEACDTNDVKLAAAVLMPGIEILLAPANSNTVPFCSSAAPHD